MDYIILAEHAVAIGCGLVTAASAICAVTPTPDPMTPRGKLYRWIEMAGLVTKRAKELGFVPADPAADKLEAGAVDVAKELLGKSVPATAVAVSSALLAGCAGGSLPVVSAKPADPAIVAKINYVCAYSGAFKFADTAASYVIPVPGVGAAKDALNAAVTDACLHPEAIAKADADVVALIRQFKSLGKM